MFDTKKLKPERINIIIVDDEKEIRNHLENSIKAMGHNVSVAYSGEEAVEICKSENFQLMVMDLVMPGLHGLELLKSIKEVTPDICIIVLTRDSNVKNAVQAVKSGAYDYLTKPCDNDEIEIAIKQAAERCLLLRELEEKSHYKNLLISKSINDLNSLDETIRRLAAENLGEFGDECAIDALLELFEDESIAVQETAQDALIKIGGETTIKKIIPMLQSNKANIRNFVTEMLENLKEKAIPALSELLTDNDHDVRKFAVDALGSIGCAEGIEHLIKALNDPHVNVSSGAAEALGKIGDDRATDALLDKLEGDPWLVYAVIESLGKISNNKAVEPLINLPHNGDDVLLSLKIRALGKIGDQKAAGFLFSLFEIQDDCLKAQVIEALECICEKSNADIFEGFDKDKLLNLCIPMLTVDDDELKLSTVNMISKMKSNNSVEALLPSLSDSNEEIKEAALQAIVRSDISGNGLTLLLDNLKTGNDDLQQTIIMIFAATKSKEAGDQIAELLKNHSNSAVREEAANALGFLLNKRQYTNNLISALKDESCEVKKTAVHSLGIIQDPKAIKPLVSLLSDSDINEEAMKALILIGGENTRESVLPLLRHSNYLCRMAAVTIIGDLKLNDITKYISVALYDQNAQVRKAAIDVIAKTEEDSFFIDDLIEALHDGDKFVQIAASNTLSKFNDKRIIDPLIASLHNPDERIRYKSVQGLMKFKEERILYALISLLSDKSNMVKIITLEALGELGNDSAICHIENMLETEEDEDLFEAANKAIERLQYSS